MTEFNNIINIETVDSTNNYLKSNLAEFDNGTVLFSIEQTRKIIKAAVRYGLKPQIRHRGIYNQPG